MNDLLRRQAALDKTSGRFRGTPFVWGKTDCLKMVHFHLRARGKKVPKVPAYSSALGAKRALKRAGFSSLADLFDSLLERIAPAEMLPGDIALIPGTDGLECAGVSMGGKLLCWHSNSEVAVNVTPHVYIGAWRA